MKKKTLVFTTLSLFALTALSQVDDVSITVAPTVGYNWFDSKSTVQHGAMYGLQAGFGFGKVIELRGIYERSLDLKQHFGKYESDIQNYFPDFNLTDQTIDITRVGGEFKTNIPIGNFSPYMILGTGKQTFERELTSGSSYKNENLYGTGGLGFKFNMGNRTTFNIEGRGIVYNMNPGSLLYNDGGSSDFDTWINNQDQHTMYNWSLMAGLQFYFGGRNEGELSAMDKAYLKRFSSGMSGTKVTFSPVGAYLQFNNSAPYRDTYMLGGMLGVDLTDFVGLKAYYYQATEDENPSLNFDKLAMYGADFVGKLNVPRGIVPYISIGGGYIQVQDDYQGKSIFPPALGAPIYQQANSGYYAKGGVGVEVPLSKYVQVFGAANLLYTMNDEASDITQIRNTTELSQHNMYNVGLRLNFGKRANTVQQTNRAFDRRYESERSAYDNQIIALEEELKKAYQNNDTQKAIEIIEQKKTIDSLQYNPTEKGGLIRLTPAELESLIDKVLDGLEKKDTATVENRLDNIERLIYSSYPADRQATVYDTVRPIATPHTQQNDISKDLLRRELDLLYKQLEEQRKNIEEIKNRQNPVPSPPVEPLQSRLDSQNDPVILATNDLSDYGRNRQLGLNPYIGVNFGTATTFNTGVRANYGFDNTAILFMPEAYVALGDNVGFGASANGIIPFQSSTSAVNPYAGVGVGLHKLGDDIKFSPNVIAGVTYELGSGRVTADYTVRGLFKNNQLALGYRFNF